MCGYILLHSYAKPMNKSSTDACTCISNNFEPLEFRAFRTFSMLMIQATVMIMVLNTQEFCYSEHILFVVRDYTFRDF